MLRRMAALAFAGLVLAFAFAVRAERDGRAPDSPASDLPADVVGGPPAENPYEVFDDDEVSLLCVEELEAFCRDVASMGIDVRTEAAWATVGRVRDGGDLGSDAWLTIRPFDELALETPEGTPSVAPLDRRTGVLARSPVVLTGPLAAMAELRSACPDAVGRFACATAAERARLVAVHPPSSALGTLALTALAHELGADPSPAAAGISDPAIAIQVAAAGGAVRRTQSPLLDAERIAGRMVALTAEADLLARLATAEYDDRERAGAAFAVDYPIDVRALEIIAIARPDFRRLGDLDRVLRSRGVGFAFERAGYLPADEDSYLLDLTLFADRPPVRTDLTWNPAVVEAVRTEAG